MSSHEHVDPLSLFLQTLENRLGSWMELEAIMVNEELDHS